MKNTIMYYYNFSRLRMFIKNGKTYFTDDKNIFSFERVRDNNEIIQLYNLIEDNNLLDKIVININNSIFTPYNGKEYILIKKNTNKKKLLLPFINNNDISRYNLLLRNNWSNIWSIKIDYIEYQYQHIKGQYPIIDESIDYYLGLAENAIEYYEYAVKLDEFVRLSFCRRRIIDDKMYNPNNIIIDYKERDIAENIKYMYFFNNTSITIIINDIKKLKLTKKEVYLLYSRLLYPSYYFDIYEGIVNDKENILNMINILNKRKGFEIILNQVNEYFNELKKVEWLT